MVISIVADDIKITLVLPRMSSYDMSVFPVGPVEFMSRPHVD